MRSPEGIFTLWSVSVVVTLVYKYIFTTGDAENVTVLILTFLGMVFVSFKALSKPRRWVKERYRDLLLQAGIAVVLSAILFAG